MPCRPPGDIFDLLCQLEKRILSHQGFLLRYYEGTCILAVLLLSRGLYDMSLSELGGGWGSHTGMEALFHTEQPSGSPWGWSTAAVFSLFPEYKMSWIVLWATQLIGKWVSSVLKCRALCSYLCSGDTWGHLPFTVLASLQFLALEQYNF